MRCFLYIIFEVKKIFFFRPVLIFGLKSKVAIIIVDIFGQNYGEDRNLATAKGQYKDPGSRRMGL